MTTNELVGFDEESKLTMEQFKQALPEHMRKNINPEVVKNVNALLYDPNLHETFRENLLGYTGIMLNGKHKLTSYVNAVKFCTYKMMGKTNLDAFIAAFPDRYNDYIARNISAKDIASYISIYNKSVLVTKIMEQSLIPTWILNQDVYQKAINVQAELMMTANSEKVRCDAANSLLTHLKMPDKAKVELDVTDKANDSIKALRDTMAALGDYARQQIEEKVITAERIASQSLVFENGEL